MTWTPRSSRSAPGDSSMTRAKPSGDTQRAAPVGTTMVAVRGSCAQRREVEVIGVAVRDQDQADVGEVGRREAGLDRAAHAADPAAEHRIERDREAGVARDHAWRGRRT